MTITATSRAVVQDNASPDQTNVTGSITLAASSKVVICSFCVTDADATYYDPQISTTMTGFDTALARTSRSSNLAISFNPVFCLFEGIMGVSPSAGTITIDWHTDASTAYGTFQVVDLVGSVAIPTHKQAIATAKVEDDAGGNSETHTTNSLGSAATTGNLCIVSFGASKDGGVAVATPAGWSPIGTPGSANYAQIGMFSKTDFTGTSVTCTDLGDIVDNSGSVLMEFEEVGGGGPAPNLILPVTRSGLRLG